MKCARCKIIKYFCKRKIKKERKRLFRLITKEESIIFKRLLIYQFCAVGRSPGFLMCKKHNKLRIGGIVEKHKGEIKINEKM